MSPRLSLETEQALQAYDFDAKSKAEYFRKAVAGGLSAKAAFVAMALNIAEGSPALAKERLAELKELAKAYEEVRAEEMMELSKLEEEISG